MGISTPDNTRIKRLLPSSVCLKFIERLFTTSTLSLGPSHRRTNTRVDSTVYQDEPGHKDMCLDVKQDASWYSTLRRLGTNMTRVLNFTGKETDNSRISRKDGGDSKNHGGLKLTSNPFPLFLFLLPFLDIRY